MIKRMLLAHGDDVAGAAAVLWYSRRSGSEQATNSSLCLQLAVFRLLWAARALLTQLRLVLV
jgi:hypothetical protein